MGTSSQSGASDQNNHYALPSKTVTQYLSYSRPRSAFYGNMQDQTTNDDHDNITKPTKNIKELINRNTIPRSETFRHSNVLTGKLKLGHSSAHKDLDISDYPLVSKDKGSISFRDQSKVDSRYSPNRPGSATALGCVSRFPQGQLLAKPRPHSSIIPRSRVPSTPPPFHPQLRRTPEDLPMQHTQEDALTMLGRKRAETAAQNRVLRQEGDDFKMVSNFGRRMFDCAVNNRGKCPLPPPSPSEAAALFFSAPRPSWSTQARDSNRLKPRAQSMTAEQTPEIGSPTSSRQRPDSEPPIKWREDRELNHLRHHRQMYPHINRLVQRYNEDMKVVCSQVPDECEKRRNSKDYSVASEFFLVPLRQAEEAETKSELGTVDSEVSKQGEGNIKENVSAHSKESNLLLQQENKMEDQLTREPELPVPSPKSLDVKEETAGDKEAIVDEEPSPPWRCWVDDATVSTIHSRASSLVTTEEVALEEDPTMQKGHIAHTSAKHADAHSPGALTPGTPQSPAGALVKEHISPQLAQPAQKEKKGRKKVEETLPEPPAPPLVEPEIILEEVVEEEAVPEPEPEPVPPSYICPSSEGKSHAVEIRRWIYKSPFKAANKTMPIF